MSGCRRMRARRARAAAATTLTAMAARRSWPMDISLNHGPAVLWTLCYNPHGQNPASRFRLLKSTGSEDSSMQFRRHLWHDNPTLRREELDDDDDEDEVEDDEDEDDDDLDDEFEDDDEDDEDFDEDDDGFDAD